MADLAPPGRGRRRTSRTPVRRSLLLVGVVAVVLALVAALLGWRLGRTQADGLAGRAVVTASSTALGFSARDAVGSGSAAAPGAGWRSADETVGAWLELTWSGPTEVARITLVRDRPDEPGITAGFLEFGDGSFLQLRLSATDQVSEVTFEPRTVDRVRFTVSEVSQDAGSVTLAEVLVENPPPARGQESESGPDGNAATRGTLSLGPGGSAGDGAADPAPLQDGGSGADLGAVWRLDAAAGASLTLTWSRPRELSSVELFGALGGGAELHGATLLFDDGSRLPVGAVLPDPGRPTVVSFMPRVTRSLRLDLDVVEGSGPLSLSEWRVYDRAGLPWVPERPAGGDPTTEELDCDPAVTAGLEAALVVECPTTGSSVEDTVILRTRSDAGYSTISATVVPADPALPEGSAVRAAPDAAGMTELVVPTAGAGPGPFFVRVSARGLGRATEEVALQLVRPGAAAATPVASSPAARGRTLTYAEEFDRPLTLSRNGIDADYAAAKPTWDGAQDFGEAIFPDPASGPRTVEVVGGQLRIRVAPAPPGTVDPQGWNRTHVGGLLASARQGGSGFSAQYGYFEARMLAPAAPGTWPAFWTLPSPNLVRAEPVEAEFDAVELYGHDAERVCHATHSHQGGEDGGETRCEDRFSARDALGWHTYGVSVTPSSVRFYVDGRLTGTAPQVEGGDAPMFFLVNLALGGGWPIELGGVQGRAELHVDYVRVYV